VREKETLSIALKDRERERKRITYLSILLLVVMSTPFMAFTVMAVFDRDHHIADL
jgi:predicted O-linked N-acetylglucosamine transferase (SPINDLY family)